MANLKDLTNTLGSLFQSGANNVNAVTHSFQIPKIKLPPIDIGQAAQSGINNTQNYFNPTKVGSANNPLPNFWTTPLAKGLGNVQQFNATAPRLNLQPLVDNIHNPVQKFVAKGALGIGESIANIPSDILRSGNQLGTDVRTGDIKKPFTLARDVAGAALPIFNIATLGGGGIAKGIAKNVIKDAGYPALKQALKEGAITGGKYGGVYGLLSGLASSNDSLKQLEEVAKQGTIGVVGGAALGGGIGAISNRVGAVLQAMQRDLKMSEPQARDALGKWVKNEAQSFAGIKKAQNKRINNAMGQPEGTPLYPDVVDAYLTKKLGLSKDRNYQEGKVSTDLLTGGLGKKDANAGLYDTEIKNIQKEGIYLGKGDKPVAGTVPVSRFNDKDIINSQNTVDKSGVDKYVKRIQAGERPPVIIGSSERRGGNYIIDGHTKLKAYEQLGITDIPVIDREGGATLHVAEQPLSDVSKGMNQIQQLQPELNQTGQVSQGGLKLNQPINSSSPNIVSQDVKKVILGSPVKQKQLITRMKGSSNFPNEITQALNGTYVPKTNEETINIAKNVVRLDPKNAEIRALSPQNAVDQAIGAELFNKYMSTGNVSKANEIINATSGTTPGQMVQILSQYDKTTPQGAVKFAQSTINQYNKTHANTPLQLSNDTIKSLFDKATAIQKMPQGRERNILSQNLMEQVNALIPSSIIDKGITVWKAGLLTSLRTHERNLIGNTIHQGAEIAKDIPASVADKLMSLKTGNRSLTLTTRGIGSGTQKGLRSAKDIITTGFDPEQAIAKYDVKNITWGNNPIEQGLKKYTDTVFRTLGAADKPFYNASFARSLYDQAGASAINAGRNGDSKFIQNLVNSPTSQMLANATKDAETATFKNKNMLSDVASSFKQKAGPLGDIVAPFTGVPSSIAGQIVAYSPIGLIKGALNAGKVVAGQVPELQRQAAQEIGRGVMGTGLIGIGAYLASKGLITGQPKDAQESRQWQLQGKQANSILVNGKWRAIGSIGPEFLVSLAGAKAQQELSPNGGGVGALAAGVGKDFLSQTFLQGVQGPLNALTDPARYAQQYAQGQIASGIPNIVKDTAKAFDPLARQTNSIGDAIKSGIPGVRNTLLPQRDALGQPIKQQPTGAGAFLDLFNSKTPINNDPVISELSRLNDTGNNATPSKLGKAQTINGVKTTLTPEQLDAFNGTSGLQVKQALNSLIKDPNYLKLSDQDKSTAVSNTIAQARKQARGNTDINNPTVKQISASGKYTLVSSTGAVKQIDLSTLIPYPTLTNNNLLDKKLISSYKSSLTTRGNDIIALYKAGKIDANTAEVELNKLATASSRGASTKKPKKIGAIKLTKASAIKPFKLKLSKAPKFRIKKTPTFKLAKSKTPAKFKVAKSKTKFGKFSLTA